MGLGPVIQGGGVPPSNLIIGQKIVLPRLDTEEGGSDISAHKINIL